MLSVKRTVSGSTASIFSTMAMLARARDPVAGSRMRCMVAMTSSADSGLPLWNLTPSRSLKVHTLRSSEAVQLTARSGLVVRSRSMRVRPLKTRWTKMYSSPMVVLAGSRLFRQLPTATRSVPCAQRGRRETHQREPRQSASDASAFSFREAGSTLASVRCRSELVYWALWRGGGQTPRFDAMASMHPLRRGVCPPQDRYSAAARACVRTMCRYSSTATHSSGLAMLLGVQP